ncbi:MAG TPA: cytochrome c oxidase subunit II [Gammaproteobacteria bacterium]|nr:cytochrome c oxidase subunit II [Gammaproteobacteria bacterium]
MSVIKQCLVSHTLLLITMLVAPFSVLAEESKFNMPRGVTEISEEVYDIHMLVFYICCVIGIAVFAVMFYSLLKHRKSVGAVPSQFHDNTAVEIIWTLVPTLILVLIAVPATKTLLKIEVDREADMSIKVTGWQWKWQYEYLDEDISFFSNLSEASNQARQRASGIDPSTVENYLLDVDNPVVIPVNTRVRFLVTSADVIHSWWVPALGWKQDAIPGFINTAWTEVKEPGIYRGQCAELCGKDHGYMPVVLEAKSQADYAEWVKEQQRKQEEAMLASGRDWSMDELMSRGEKIYTANCAACHQANGEGIGMFPALKGSPVATQGSVEEHTKLVLNGLNAMPAFGAQLNDADIAAIVTYERNAWGNDVGDMIQPSAVKALR